MNKIPKSSIVYGNVATTDRSLSNESLSGYIVYDEQKQDEQKQVKQNDQDGQIICQLYEAKQIAFALYKKFIQVGSEYEINISSSMRDELINLMDDKDTWLKIDRNNVNIQNEAQMLYDMFVPSMKEMIMLLRFSFQRLHFSKVELFEKIEQILK